MTHHHWDHTNGVAELKEKYNVPLFAGANSQLNTFTQPIQANNYIELPDYPTFQLIPIPGHTLDHVAYYAPGIVFTGDTLFSAGCGRVFEGNAEMMFTALQKIAALPEFTNIYCGHEYTEKNLRFAALVEPSNAALQKRLQEVIVLRKKNLPTLPVTLQIEKATNPFLRCHKPEIIAAVSKFSGMKLSTPIEVFYWLRKWKDSF